MRRDTALRCVFLGHVRACTLPAKSLARLVSLASLRLRRGAYVSNCNACVALCFSWSRTRLYAPIEKASRALSRSHLCIYDEWRMYRIGNATLRCEIIAITQANGLQFTKIVDFQFTRQGAIYDLH